MVSFMSGGHHGIPETDYLFIDGACLRYLLKDYSNLYFSGNEIDLNLSLFTSRFTKVFYYDAIPEKSNSVSEELFEQKQKNINEFIEKLELLDRFHVYLGKTQVRRKRVVQKQVDMMIAIDMLKHSFNKNMNKATLFTTDSDFIPLIDILVEYGMNISLWYGETENCKTNKELLKAADKRVRIGIDTIYESCTKDFKNKFTIPEKRMVFDRSTDVPLLKSWSLGNERHLDLYQSGSYFKIYIQDNLISTGLQEIKHNDLSILKTYLVHEHNIEIPE